MNIYMEDNSVLDEFLGGVVIKHKPEELLPLSNLDNCVLGGKRHQASNPVNFCQLPNN